LHLIAVCFVIPVQTQAQSLLHAFKLLHVALLPGVFKNAQQTDMTYMMALDPDRLFFYL
jgi:hypothetical protein